MDTLGAIGVTALVILIFVLLTIAIVYVMRVKKVPPNQVLVISGRTKKSKNPKTGEVETVGYRLVRGGRAFIWPVFERVDLLSLELMTIEVGIADVYTSQGVPVSLDSVAQIKVASDDVSIATAAERFLFKTRAEIMDVAHETMAGHLRAIVGALTVEEIYRDRDAFAQRVQEVSAGDLANMGLGIDSFVIKDIQDSWGYLEALGRPRTAEVKRDAIIAENKAKEREAESERNFNIQKAAYDREVARQRAEADLAYNLQQNITNQTVRQEEIQVEVVAKAKQIEVQQQEALRKERELEATVRRPAEAEQFRIETLAKAKRFQVETEATGEAAAIRQRGEAEADAIRARGIAEAEVERAKGFAEAQAMEKKADAWQRYNQAAIIQQLIDALPEVANAIAQPLAKTDRIVVISQGDGNGTGAGASKITADITSIIAQVPAAVEALTGVDLVSAIASLPGIAEGNTGKTDEKPADKPAEASAEADS
ncbi:MAG: SPFH domain-containing protein [Anaerolineae bacterium]|nr:SPFH domain-containing protein [Anaerolineae bacterium]